jgi:hypothetical protein
MAVRIRSLITSAPITVPLASGTTVRLSPGQVSPELPDAEVAENTKVATLRDRGLISVETLSKSGPKAKAKSRSGDGEQDGK